MQRKEKIGIEIERKYIIAMPDFNLLRSLDGYNRSDIVQTYLKSVDGATRRVRMRTTDGNSRYYETLKVRIDEMSSTEVEREIDREEYTELLKLAREDSTPIEKVRHLFSYNSQLFEIDVYPNWQNTAIMETELDSRETSVEMPPFIHIIREVTGNKAYSNAGMSRAFPPEDIL